MTGFGSSVPAATGVAGATAEAAGAATEAAAADAAAGSRRRATAAAAEPPPVPPRVGAARVVPSARAARSPRLGTKTWSPEVRPAVICVSPPDDSPVVTVWA